MTYFKAISLRCKVDESYLIQANILFQLNLSVTLPGIFGHVIVEIELSIL